MDDKQKLAWALSHYFRAPVCTLEGLVNVMERQGLLDVMYIEMFKAQFTKWYAAIDKLTSLLLINEEQRKLKWMELLIEISMISESMQELIETINNEMKTPALEKAESVIAQLNFMCGQVSQEVEKNKDLVDTRSDDNN